MAKPWEYTRAWASLNEETHPGKSEDEIKKTAAKEWIDMLNKLATMSSRHVVKIGLPERKIA